MRHHPKLPIRGYIALILLTGVLLAGVYLVASWEWENNIFYSPSRAGIVPILAICWVSFILVCIFDAVYDRVAEKQEQRKRERLALRFDTSRDSAFSRASRESSKSREREREGTSIKPGQSSGGG